jgi:hypothetical protein
MRQMHSFQARFRLSTHDSDPIFSVWMLHCNIARLPTISRRKRGRASGPATQGLRILRLPDVKPPCSTCRGLVPRPFFIQWVRCPPDCARDGRNHLSCPLRTHHGHVCFDVSDFFRPAEYSRTSNLGTVPLAPQQAANRAHLDHGARLHLEYRPAHPCGTEIWPGDRLSRR